MKEINYLDINEDAVKKAYKQVNKEIKKAFKHNKFENIKLKKFKGNFYLCEYTGREDLDNVYAQAKDAKDSFLDRIVRGVGSIYKQVCEKINKTPGMNYTVSLSFYSTYQPYVYAQEEYDVRVSVEMRLMIEFKDPCELEN